jgi:hypothetical protein
MTDEGFQRIWKSAVRYRHVSPGLQGLVREVYAHALEFPPNEGLVVDALDALLSFLASEEGRTDANCCATDLFFSAERESGWSRLAEPIQQILSDIGGTLHDAIYAPHIASNFSSLPEQLLARVRALRSGLV